MHANKSRLTKSGFASLIGILLTLIIIAILFYLAANTASKNTSTDTSNATSNPKSVLDKAKSAVSEINKRQSEAIGE